LDIQETWVIETADLQIGTSLSFDLSDKDGNVLHRAGMAITDRLLERLHKKGIHSVTVKGGAPNASSPDQILIDSFPSEVTRRIHSIISDVEVQLSRFASAIENQERIDVRPFDASISHFADQVEQQASAALAVIASKIANLGDHTNPMPNARSTLLGLLGVATCVMMEVDDTNCMEIGLAGMLHDCSLQLHPEWINESGKMNEEELHNFRNHPIESASLLEGQQGISQADGSGFPNGLIGDQVEQGAKILNLADAYLNIVQPNVGDHVLTSDAIAYLCHHTSQGKFDADVFRGLIKGLSMYPVGSIVELDDATTAIVIWSNHNRPLEPVVKSLNGRGKNIDLSISPRSIVGPSIDTSSPAKRINKSNLHCILWRSDLIL
jgi:HD-GYP domain-containing protein (c-di-GMP phosphodiesterase class II)